ncbi:MAG: hypothetical protein RQ885_08265 [Desulfurococcales archaeon]|nr:hypothetical protein [Desulfurococcales archaeon]
MEVPDATGLKTLWIKKHRNPRQKYQRRSTIIGGQAVDELLEGELFPQDRMSIICVS